MAGFITSADAIFTLTVQTLYNAPVTLNNWAADRAWESTELEMAETQMSVDGRLNSGWVPNPFDMTLQFSANSDSVPIFEAIMTYQTTSRAILALGAVITVPAISRKYTLSNGLLMRGSFAPTAGRVLEARSFGLRWGSSIPAAVS